MQGDFKRLDTSLDENDGTFNGVRSRDFLGCSWESQQSEEDDKMINSSQEMKKKNVEASVDNVLSLICFLFKFHYLYFIILILEAMSS